MTGTKYTNARITTIEAPTSAALVLRFISLTCVSSRYTSTYQNGPAILVGLESPFLDPADLPEFGNPPCARLQEYRKASTFSRRRMAQQELRHSFRSG